MVGDFRKHWWHTDSPYCKAMDQVPQSQHAQFGAIAHTLDTSFVDWISSCPGSDAYGTFAQLAHQQDDVVAPFTELQKVDQPAPDE
eukprot:3113027-Karenia_brevis.AAC.1